MNSAMGRSHARPVSTRTGDPTALQVMISGVTDGKADCFEFVSVYVRIAGTFRGSGHAGAVSHWGR